MLRGQSGLGAPLGELLGVGPTAQTAGREMEVESSQEVGPEGSMVGRLGALAPVYILRFVTMTYWHPEQGWDYKQVQSLQVLPGAQQQQTHRCPGLKHRVPGGCKGG